MKQYYIREFIYVCKVHFSFFWPATNSNVFLAIFFLKRNKYTQNNKSIKYHFTYLNLPRHKCYKPGTILENYTEQWPPMCDSELSMQLGNTGSCELPGRVHWQRAGNHNILSNFKAPYWNFWTVVTIHYNLQRIQIFPPDIHMQIFSFDTQLTWTQNRWNMPKFL